MGSSILNTYLLQDILVFGYFLQDWFSQVSCSILSSLGLMKMMIHIKIDNEDYQKRKSRRREQLGFIQKRIRFNQKIILVLLLIFINFIITLNNIQNYQIPFKIIISFRKNTYIAMFFVTTDFILELQNIYQGNEVFETWKRYCITSRFSSEVFYLLGQ